MSARRRLPRSRLLALLLLVVSVTLCAAAVRASEAGLEYDKVSGPVGEQIDVTGGWVRVDGVEVGQSLTKREQLIGRTAGLFVIVRVTVAATGAQRLSFSQAALVTPDRTYANWTDFALAATPGFSRSTDIAFEVDPTQIDDLTLTMRPGSVVYQYEEHVAVPLGITGDNATQWRDAGRGRAVEINDSARDVGLR